MQSKLSHVLEVFGNPVAQPRARAKRFGNGVYNPSTADGWKTQVAVAARGLEHIKQPCSVVIEFRFARPKSHTGKRGLLPSAPKRHTGKPDLDNLAKSTLDAMVDCGLLLDDRIVFSLGLSKGWSDGQPGATIIVEEFGDE